MPKSLTVLPGDKFGNWTIICELEPKYYSGQKARRFRAQCNCGSKKDVLWNQIKNGQSRNCLKCFVPKNKKHGFSSMPEYIVWMGMIDRCTNEKNAQYHNYGGRGVTVCDRWNPQKGGSFENFYKDMGPRPSKFHEIDKEAVNIDNTIYCPEFVKWVHNRENSRRKRNTIWVEFMGIRIQLVSLAEYCCIKYNAFYKKVVTEGLSCEEAVRFFLGEALPETPTDR